VDLSNVFSIFIIVEEANFTFPRDIKFKVVTSLNVILFLQLLKFKLVRPLNVIPFLDSSSNGAPVLLGN